LAIYKLPPRIRITIVLYYVEGYSVEEVKKILKIPSGTVKSRLAKGRKLLKIKLDHMEVTYE
jgi:RNA polymerase sigma-70 factor (ECF subfamily)